MASFGYNGGKYVFREGVHFMDDMQKSCREFTEALASSAPTPGGGGAAALLGAVGAALGCMVASLTIGKPKYADVEEEVKALRDACDALRLRLLDGAQADAEGFLPLAAAYRIPKDDPTRAETLEKATLAACEAPMEILELCCRTAKLLARLGEIGSKLAISDVACGAAACRAAMQCAAMNLWINIGSLRDRTEAAALREKAEDLLDEAEPLAEKTLRNIVAELKGEEA